MKKIEGKIRQRRLERQSARSSRRKAKTNTLSATSLLSPELLPGHRVGGAKKHSEKLDRLRKESLKRAIKGGDAVALKAMREARDRGELIEQLEVVPDNTALQINLADIRSRKEAQRTERKNSVIVDGFLYLVTSPAYPDWIKVGQTSDFENRLSTYQTASPYADYTMVAVKYVENRILAETNFLALAKLVFEVKGEWIKASLEALMKEF